MKNGYIFRKVCTVFFLICISFSAIGQHQLSEINNLDSIILSISNPIYSLEYEKANENIYSFSKLIPGHPFIDILYAINEVWQTIPDSDPLNFPQIEEHLFQCIEKSEQILKTDENNPEAIFFLLMSHGLLAQYYGEQGSTWTAVSEAKKSYNAVITGFDLKELYSEFYFSSGLYNYYREKYPEMHPVYKSFVWVFRSGDMAKGLEQLEYAAENAPLSRVEATHYLAYIYLRYEEKPELALVRMDGLIKDYPNNAYFKILYLEALGMLHNLDKATAIIDELLQHDRLFYRMCGNTFKGLFEEKYNQVPEEAVGYYERALLIGENFDNEGLHAKSMAYAGLARISDGNNDTETAKSYYRKAKKIAQTKNIEEESEEYLKSH